MQSFCAKINSVVLFFLVLCNEHFLYGQHAHTRQKGAKSWNPKYYIIGISMIAISFCTTLWRFFVKQNSYCLVFTVCLLVMHALAKDLTVLKNNSQINKVVRAAHYTCLQCMTGLVRIVSTNWKNSSDCRNKNIKNKLCRHTNVPRKTQKFHCELNFQYFSPARSVGARTAFWPFRPTLRVSVTAKLSGAYWGVSRVLVILWSASSWRGRLLSCWSCWPHHSCF